MGRDGVEGERVLSLRSVKALMETALDGSLRSGIDADAMSEPRTIGPD